MVGPPHEMYPGMHPPADMGHVPSGIVQVYLGLTTDIEWLGYNAVATNLYLQSEQSDKFLKKLLCCIRSQLIIN